MYDLTMHDCYSRLTIHDPPFTIHAKMVSASVALYRVWKVQMTVEVVFTIDYSLLTTSFQKHLINRFCFVLHVKLFVDVANMLLDGVNCII